MIERMERARDKKYVTLCRQNEPAQTKEGNDIVKIEIGEDKK